MRRFILVSLVLALTALPVAQAADSKPTDKAASDKSTGKAGKELSVDELRKLQSSMKQSEFLAVDFVQTTYTAMRGKSFKREGKAKFAKPNKFAWMLETPTKQYRIYNGKDFYDYSPETNSAVRFAASGPRAEELKQVVDLVMNFDSLLKRYDLVKATDEGQFVRIELKPKDAGEIIGAELHYDKDESFISFLRLNMRNKNHLIHEFSSPKRNAVPADFFELPKGVKVSEGG